MEIKQLSSTDISLFIPQLAALLQNVVHDGASVGFLPPLSQTEAQTYWLEVELAIQGPYKLLWIALEQDQVVGTIQLNLESRANGSHRAEVAKVLVHTAYRRKGIAAALMQMAESKALQLGRTTLVLDTMEGHAAEVMYRSLGWQTAGVIPRYAIWQDAKQYGTVLMYKLLKAES